MRDRRRVLIVSPHFPPFNAPDHQRVRTSLPYFAQFGWEATVLAGRAEDAGPARDDLLANTVPESVPVHRSAAWPERWCRRFGFGHFGYRCVHPIYRAGSALLEAQHFDLVYFSTTMFNVMPLGIAWARRFGVPFVLDIQDPWYAGPACIYDAKSAPGGLLKYKLSQAIARTCEPPTVRRASGIISVSQGYIETLCSRYGESLRRNAEVIPFGAPERDYQHLETLGVEQTVFDPRDGLVHWVSVGRGGSDLQPVLTVLFRCLARLRAEEPARWNRVRLHFVGTSYAPAGRARKTIEPVAAQLGVGDLVEENPERIPYFQSLKVLSDSDAILVLGSPDAHYTASKLFPVLLAQRPFRALFHTESLVAGMLRDLAPDALLPFGNPAEAEEAFSAGLQSLISARENQRPSSFDLGGFTAERLTEKQCNVFNKAIQ